MLPPRTGYHHGNLRTELLASAERLLEEVGAEQLSLREMARRVGVSHGAPRQHFADKRCLLGALAEVGFQRLGAELDAVLAGVHGPLFTRLVVFAQTWVGFATQYPGLHDLMFTRGRVTSPNASGPDSGAAFAVCSAMFERARLDGEIAAGDHEVVVLAALAAVLGCAVLVTSGMSGDRPVGTLVSRVVTTLLEGIRPR